MPSESWNCQKRFRPDWLWRASCRRFGCHPGVDLLPGASGFGCSRLEWSVDRESHVTGTVSSVFYRWRSRSSVLCGPTDLPASARRERLKGYHIDVEQDGVIGTMKTGPIEVAVSGISIRAAKR